MEKAIQKWVDRVVADAEVQKMNNPLYQELKEHIEIARQGTDKALAIANSSGLSADQIHDWFPDLRVGWDAQNRITIRWSD